MLNLMDLGLVSTADALALEMALLKESDFKGFLLWVSQKPCVVIGRHQIPSAEVNIPFAERNEIPIYRRISGGGTVFHDTENLNFSWILPTGNGRQVDYSQGLKPIIQALNTMGFPAEIHEESDIYCRGKKISGNAVYLYRNRILHHGTLLFDTDLLTLRKVLDSNLSRYQSRSIPSRRASVLNLAKIAPPEFASFKNFKEGLKTQLLKQHNFFGEGIDRFPTLLTPDTNSLLKDEWRWGHSPDYEFRTQLSFPNGFTIPICLHVHQGIIRELRYSSQQDPRLIQALQLLSKALMGSYHNWDKIRDTLDNLKNQAYVDGFFLNLRPSDFF